MLPSRIVHDTMVLKLIERDNIMNDDPRAFVMQLIEEGYEAKQLLAAALHWMSKQDVEDMLRSNDYPVNEDELFNEEFE